MAARGRPAVDDPALPALWDGHPVTWTRLPGIDQIFICPPPPDLGRCSRCRSRSPQDAWKGVVGPLPGESWPGEVLRTVWRAGRPVPLRAQEPAQAVIDLYAWRCPDCGLDVVYQLSTEESWDLGPEDYGPEGSVRPDDPAPLVIQPEPTLLSNPLGHPAQVPPDPTEEPVPAPAALQEFPSWELGQIADGVAARAEQHPEGSPFTELRSACVERMLWDNYFRDCWADPRFLPKFLFLRAALEAAGCSTARDAVPVLRALVEARVLEERDEPF